MRFKVVVFFFIFQNGFLFAQVKWNQLDASGKKEGLWKGVYEESKRRRYEGTFSHGKEIGTFNFFDDTKASTIIATRDFDFKDGSAYTVFYNQKKFKVSEGKVIQKMFEGPWKYYHADSPEIMVTENYSKGKLEGLRTVYYNDGKKAEECVYKNGLKEGVYTKYTQNGFVLEQSNFKNNEYNGEAVFNDANGVVASKGQFKNGKKVGNWQFFKSGKLAKEVNMSDPKSASKVNSN